MINRIITLSLSSVINSHGFSVLERFFRRWTGVAVFAAGMLTFLIIQLGLVILPASQRNTPVQTDDAYSYILNAVQIKECIRQDCPALVDLRSQMTQPSSNTNANWIRSREYTRIFILYSPLHSAMLAGLNLLGLSWEAAYNAMVVFGAVFVGLAVVYWLLVQWGYGPAGIALVLLSFASFPKQSLIYVVPGVFSLGIALFVWALITHKGARAGWTMVFGIFLMVAMHPVGRLYALATLFTFWLIVERRFEKHTLLIMALGLGIVLLAFTLPMVISRPELKLPADTPPANWQRGTGLQNNILEAAAIIRSWAEKFGGPISAALLLSIGFLRVPPRRKKRVWSISLVLVALLVASLFYVLPHFPAEVFGRIWMAVAIIFAGAVGNIAWIWGGAAYLLLKRIIAVGSLNVTNSKWILSPRGWGIVILILLGLLLGGMFGQTALTARDHLASTFQSMAMTQHTTMEIEQPEMLLSQACGDVLYMAETPMYYYLAHGAMQCGAIYHPALVGTQGENKWVTNNEDVRYLVAWNPAVLFSASEVVSGGNTLFLLSGDSLEVSSEQPIPLNQFYFYFDNPGKTATFNVELKITAHSDEQNPSGNDQLRFKLPNNYAGWIQLTQEDAGPAKNFRINAIRVDQAVRLRGLRIGAESGSNWPWDQGITLIFEKDMSPYRPYTHYVNFETQALYPGQAREIRVLADGGDTVLAEILR